MFLTVFMEYVFPALILAGTGAIFGVLIAICSKAFYIKVDKRLEEVTALLPGYNCGACGCAGCKGLAEKILNGEKQPSDCKPIKPEQVEVIKKYLQENKDN